jgi:hypothetical protein
MRAKINKFLATKEMTQTKFLETIGCNSNSYGRFMKLKGTWNGLQNGVYWGAHHFFLARERQEKEEKKKEKALPVADRKRKAEADAGEAAQKKKAREDLLAAIDKIELEDCNVYDDCDEVRKKSLEFIAESGITQIEFLRVIGDVNKSWRAFIGFRGAGAGAGNQSYEAAYTFLEKVRIAKGLPKTAKRKKAELEEPTGHRLVHDDGKRWVLTL